MKEGALVILDKPQKRNYSKCKLQTQKIKQMRHRASEEKVRILYLSVGSPYILREPFIYIYLINPQKVKMCCA
jgi:hypothetical protein